MSLDSDIAFALELLDEIEGIAVKRMFGGAGLYREGVMFALLAYGAIWLRADPAFAADLEALGSEGRFATKTGDRTAHLPYWRLPDGALDDPQQAAALARRASAAALRLAPLKKKPSRKPKQGDSA